MADELAGEFVNVNTLEIVKLLALDVEGFLARHHANMKSSSGGDRLAELG